MSDKIEGAPNQIRNPSDIQRAHDLLAGILTGEVPNPAPRFKREVAMYLAVLCWVLQDGHDNSFTNNLDKLERELRIGGFPLKQFLEMRAVKGK